MQLAVVLLISRMVGKENVIPDLRDFQPPKKKVKISCESGTQFKCPTSNEEMAMSSKGFVPANTQKNNVRGMRVFLEWRAQRNRAISVKVQHVQKISWITLPEIKFLAFLICCRSKDNPIIKDHPSDFVSFTKEKGGLMLSLIKRDNIQRHILML